MLFLQKNKENYLGSKINFLKEFSKSLIRVKLLTQVSVRPIYYVKKKIMLIFYWNFQPLH